MQRREGTKIRNHNKHDTQMILIDLNKHKKKKKKHTKHEKHMILIHSSST